MEAAKTAAMTAAMHAAPAAAPNEGCATQRRLQPAAALLIGAALVVAQPVMAQVDGRPIHPWATPDPQVVYVVPGPYYYGMPPVAVPGMMPGQPVPYVPYGAAPAAARRGGVEVVRPDVVLGWGGLPPMDSPRRQSSAYGGSQPAYGGSFYRR